MCNVGKSNISALTFYSIWQSCDGAKITIFALLIQKFWTLCKTFYVKSFVKTCMQETY